MRPVRVLMVVQGYVPSVGGAERQAMTLAQSLREQGHRVQVLCPRVDLDYPPGPARLDDVPVWRIAYPRWPVVGAVVLLLKQAWYLWTRRGEYDAIHVQIAHQMGAVSAVVGRLADKPVVVKFAGSFEREHGSLRRHGLASRILRVMLRRASAFQATSRRLMDELSNLGFRPERLHWLPNAVDVTRFGTLPSNGRRSDAGGPRTLLFVGRLVADKGLDVLLQAWARSLGRAGSGWHLRLVGEGGQAAALSELAAQLAIADSVEFVGELESVDAELRSADAVVLPSLREGLSNALLEAMAAGLPVLATRVSGSEDFISGGHNGWLCEPGDVDTLAVALDQLGSTSDEMLWQLGRNARRDVERRAALPVVTGRLLTLYSGLPGTPGVPS